MAKGKEWTEEEIKNIIQGMRPYLELGFSRNKACSFIGVAPSTISNFVKQDDSVGILLTSWENVVSAIAISNVRQAIQKESELDDDLKKENSWKWLERKIPDFSPTQKIDHTTDGEKITAIEVTILNNRLIEPSNENKLNETSTDSDQNILRDEE